ncbi:TPA: hypothetical protein ACHJR0_004799, partial [Escherichia coli]
MISSFYLSKQHKEPDIISFFRNDPLCARSYPRHACPLYGVVFMQVHDGPEIAPVLATPTRCDPFWIMRIHAP